MTQPLATSGTNYEPFDFFTLVHMAAGAAAGGVGASFETVTVGALAWELLEKPLKNNFPAAFPDPSQDSVPNAVVDVAAALVGWWLVKRFSR